MIVRATKKKDLKDRIQTLVEIKDNLKINPIVKEILDEHGFNIEVLDGIPISFSDDLDVSAKTTDSKIELNANLLEDTFDIIMRYVVHEIVHCLQHIVSKTSKDPHSDKEYLDRPDELEAFKYQIKFDAENRGKDKAEKYVDDLIDYHEIPEDKKNDKKRELLSD